MCIYIYSAIDTEKDREHIICQGRGHTMGWDTSNIMDPDPGHMPGSMTSAHKTVGVGPTPKHKQKHNIKKVPKVSAAESTRYIYIYIYQYVDIYVYIRKEYQLCTVSFFVGRIFIHRQISAQLDILHLFIGAMESI